MKYIVYLTTNIINNKIYIGVHKTLDPNTFDGYIGCGVNIKFPSTYINPYTPFQYAVKKYGVNNFKRITLYIYDNEEDAYKKERELVDKDFINMESNYNVFIGGKKPYGLYKPIFLFDKNGLLVKKWDRTDDASIFYNININSMYNAILYKELLCGFYWSRNDIINIKDFSNYRLKKTVYKYSIDTGKCINIYESILEASKKEKIERLKISYLAKTESIINNCCYSFKLYDTYICKPRLSLRNRYIYIYTLDGKYINKFTNKELMLFLNIKSWNTIYRAIHIQNGLYKNYQMFLEYKGEYVTKRCNVSKSKQVDVYDKESNFIKTCDSVQKASFEFNAKLSSINRVLRGLSHTANGYIFKWKVNDMV